MYRELFFQAQVERSPMRRAINEMKRGEQKRQLRFSSQEAKKHERDDRRVFLSTCL